MIKYAMKCAAGHAFDVWFPSADASDDQIARDLVACPDCGSTSVSKALMAPSVRPSRTTSSQERVADAPASSRNDAPSATAPSSVEAVSGARPPTPPPALREAIRRYRAMILARSEDVGGRFADEARDIHEGRAEERAIVGRCSVEDATDLIEEGVPIAPLPPAPPTDD